MPIKYRTIKGTATIKSSAQTVAKVEYNTIFQITGISLSLSALQSRIVTVFASISPIMVKIIIHHVAPINAKNLVILITLNPAYKYLN